MAWNAPQTASKSFPLREGEDEYDLKMQFARECARNPAEQLTAGYRVFVGPDNYGRAMQAQMWLTDPVVQEAIQRFGGPEAVGEMLPTKDQILKHISDVAISCKATQPKIALDGFKLFLEASGEMPNGNDNGGGNMYIQNVIKLPNRIEGPDEEALFEARFEAQQLKLVRDARAPRTD